MSKRGPICGAFAAFLFLLLPAGCDQAAGPTGPTRGTWYLYPGVEARSLMVTDTSVQIDVSVSESSSVVLRMDGTDFGRRRDYLRVTFQQLVLQRTSGGDHRLPGDTESLADVVLSRDSTVLTARGGARRVLTHPDSVLSGPGRMILVPAPDSSITVGLPAAVVSREVESLLSVATVAWPDSAGAIRDHEDWFGILYRDYQAP